MCVCVRACMRTCVCVVCVCVYVCTLYSVMWLCSCLHALHEKYGHTSALGIITLHVNTPTCWHNIFYKVQEEEEREEEEERKEEEEGDKNDEITVSLMCVYLIHCGCVHVYMCNSSLNHCIKCMERKCFGEHVKCKPMPRMATCPHKWHKIFYNK